MPKSIWIVNFQRYNPPHKAVNVEVRNGAPLKWVRLQVDWYDDKDVLDLPESQRWLWPALCALAGKSTPPGRVDMDAAQLAREMRTDEEQVAAALHHLWRRGRVRHTNRVAK